MDGITYSMDMNLRKFQEMVKDREDWQAAVLGSQRVGHNDRLSNSSNKVHRS